MFSFCVRGTACALLLGSLTLPAQGGEVKANPVCGGCRPTTRYCVQPVTTYRVSACAPCCRDVGPIRRFLRRVFCPRCCPPPAPVIVAPVPVPAPAPVWVPPPAPAATSAPIVPAVPPPGVDLGRPVPSTGSSLRPVAPRLTPPTPPPPVRVERIASRRGD